MTSPNTEKDFLSTHGPAEANAVHDGTSELSQRQRVILTAMHDMQRPLSAEDIAWILGYRPARTGRLAVTATLRSMLVAGTDSGAFVNRHAPNDRWGTASWSLTDAASAALRHARKARGGAS